MNATEDMPDLFPHLPRNTVGKTIRDEWNTLRRAMTDLEGVVSPGHAARVLGISRQRLHQLVNAGVIRAVQSENFTYVSARDIEERLRLKPTTGHRYKKTS